MTSVHEKSEWEIRYENERFALLVTDFSSLNYLLFKFDCSLQVIKSLFLELFCTNDKMLNQIDGFTCIQLLLRLSMLFWNQDFSWIQISLNYSFSCHVVFGIQFNHFYHIDCQWQSPCIPYVWNWSIDMLLIKMKTWTEIRNHISIIVEWW